MCMCANCIVLQSSQRPSKHARDLTRRSSTGISQITHAAGGKATHYWFAHFPRKVGRSPTLYFNIINNRDLSLPQ